LNILEACWKLLDFVKGAAIQGTAAPWNRPQPEAAQTLKSGPTALLRLVE
jgi:hypothetical protein